MTGKFHIYEDKAGQFRWRLKAANGAIVAASELPNEGPRQEGAEDAQRAADKAEIVDG